VITLGNRAFFIQIRMKYLKKISEIDIKTLPENLKTGIIDRHELRKLLISAQRELDTIALILGENKENILNLVAEFCEISIKDISTASRFEGLVLARHLITFYYFDKYSNNMQKSEITKKLQKLLKRDRTTIDYHYQPNINIPFFRNKYNEFKQKYKI
jgi:chromosomal replication initiation ATPase DnaA